MIFVDPLVQYGPGIYADAQAARVGARNGHAWCHLFSDEKDPEFPELKAFARKIGLRQEWFQGDHFDLVPGCRLAAIRAGAREVTRSEAVAIWRQTPQARRWRCRRCGHRTERLVQPPAACPGCGASAP